MYSFILHTLINVTIYTYTYINIFILYSYNIYQVFISIYIIYTNYIDTVLYCI